MKQSKVFNKDKHSKKCGIIFKILTFKIILVNRQRPSVLTLFVTSYLFNLIPTPPILPYSLLFKQKRILLYAKHLLLTNANGLIMVIVLQFLFFLINRKLRNTIHNDRIIFFILQFKGKIYETFPSCITGQFLKSHKQMYVGR